LQNTIATEDTEATEIEKWNNCSEFSVLSVAKKTSPEKVKKKTAVAKTPSTFPISFEEG
jgi:hypothetical protein